MDAVLGEVSKIPTAFRAAKHSCLGACEKAQRGQEARPARWPRRVGLTPTPYGDSACEAVAEARCYQVIGGLSMIGDSPL
jgi:hypothetical protein